MNLNLDAMKTLVILCLLLGAAVAARDIDEDAFCGVVGSECTASAAGACTWQLPLRAAILSVVPQPPLAQQNAGAASQRAEGQAPGAFWGSKAPTGGLQGLCPTPTPACPPALCFRERAGRLERGR